MTTPSLARRALAALAGLAAALAPIGSAPAAPPAGGSLVGVLTDHAGTPTTGLRIYAFPERDPQNYTGRSFVGADGAFAVTDLPAGRYKLMIATGYGVSWSDGQVSFDAATAYPVTAGADTRAAARLPELATVEGILADRQQRPVPGATVTLLDPVATSLTSSFPAAGSTDALGRYAVRAIPVPYRVQYRIDRLTQYHPRQGDPAKARVHPLAAGQRLTLDERLLQHGTVGGRLLAAGGGPARSVEVQLRADRTLVGTAHTDADGRYELGRVYTGSYRVSFHSPTTGVQWAPGRIAADRAKGYTVRDGQRTTVDDTLLTPGALRGRVRLADGGDAAGAPVELYREGDDAPGAANFILVQRTRTDAAGGYRFDPAVPGRYYLAFPRGERGSQLQWAPRGTAAPAAPSAVVQPGSTTTVDERLLPIGTVTGALAYADGRPARLTTVRVHDEQNAVRATVYADGDGRFTVDALFPGRYKLSFQRGAGPVQWAVGKATAEEADWVAVEPGRTATVRDTLRG
ncbi:hypothetical protein [Pilimelia anulata]|uniref:hypothetical protein n=1 Tax=Pilimelia anulata TaxID=53371 RepID=UPI00166F4410|nr:hypothetical protein [Pilimelia anulata]